MGAFCSSRAFRYACCAVLPLDVCLVTFMICKDYCLLVRVVSAVNVYLPKDRVTSQHQGYGFVEFKSEEDADYVSHCPPVQRMSLHMS
jgi:RNA recognition motif-containing protein